MIEFWRKIKARLARHLPLLVVTALVAGLLVIYLWNAIFISVQPGQGGVLWLRFFGGTVIDRVYGEGMHVIAPWDRMDIYNVRIQEAARDFNVLTRNGLQVRIWVSIRYYPEYTLLGALHQKIGPDYADKVIVPTVEAVLRSTVGRLDAEEVYATNTLIAKSISEAVEQVARRFLNIDAVLITKVELPADVAAAIQSKMVEYHKAEAYAYILQREGKEAERRRIEAEGLARYNTILNATLTPPLLKYRGIQATEQLATSPNAKTVVVGGGKDGLPLILGMD
jgi:regulator of protease activity HflC (stomatin/prohibitin superfamily)